VKALEPGTKIPITKENANAISGLASEFWRDDLVSEYSALQAASAPDLTTSRSQQIVMLEHETSSHSLTVVHELTESIRNHDRQVENHISSIKATTVTLQREMDDVRYYV
jgi:hypothetical protein